ncbi:MAG: class I mannose-6-phosphate isomerase [Lachnospiraceae bacterium]|nr:class I mannose-6-phosphate isomerase [Lachnospiraceae bacterium]
MDIMKLLPTGKDYLWGGTRLRDEFGKDLEMTPLAETWECSTHPDGLSIVLNGACSGKTLSRVLKEHPEYLGTKMEQKGSLSGEIPSREMQSASTETPGAQRDDDENVLPVIVKFIDADKDLSVQVHPDDAFAREYEHDNGKSEMWYVVDAREGTSLIYGFAHPVSEGILRDALAENSLDKHLQKVRVHKDDVFYVPAGTVHGIGAGALIVEVQESSDVTYRLYDYNRIDKNGRKRELHFEKAIRVMDMQVAPDVKQLPRMVHYYPGSSREILCRCKYFQTERIRVKRECSFSVLGTSFQILLCINGSGTISSETGAEVSYSKGECIFLPAGLGRCHVAGESELLKVRC